MATSFNIGRPTGGARQAALWGVFATVAMLLVAGVAPASEPLYDGPRLAIPEKEQDFGLVTRGEILEATFELHNVGSEPLKILRVKPG